MSNNSSNPQSGAHEEKITLTISVNGQGSEDSYPTHQKIRIGVEAALRDSNNKLDLNLYDVTLDGNPLDLESTWLDARVPSGATILVSNKPGKKA